MRIHHEIIPALAGSIYRAELSHKCQRRGLCESGISRNKA